MEALCSKFFDETARIENMVLLAGVLSDDALPDVASEFLKEEDIENIEYCFGPLPEWVKDEMGDDEEALPQWLMQEKKFGFLVQMATPVMRWDKGGNSASFSWGCYATKWVYGDTLDEAMDKGFSWVEDCRAKEKLKAAA